MTVILPLTPGIVSLRGFLLLVCLFDFVCFSSVLGITKFKSKHHNIANFLVALGENLHCLYYNVSKEKISFALKC